MKKWKIFVSAFLTVAAIAACCTAVGCKKKQKVEETTEPEHVHTYATDWSSDDTYHWHASACGHEEEISGKDVHSYSDYRCTVCGRTQYDFDGLILRKTVTQYDLVNTEYTTISDSDISVVASINNGTGEILLDRSSYTLEYYKGNQKLNNLNDVDSGAYNIWAKATVAGENLETFGIVYVVDEVTEVRMLSGATRTQKLGLDKLRETWKFRVTYKSGKIEEIDANDERISVGNFSTMKTGTRAASIKFTEINCLGEAYTQTLTTNYTITEPDGSVAVNNYSFNALKETLDATQQAEGTVALSNDNFTGANAFLKVSEIATNVNYRGPSNNVLEIKGDALCVTFKGIGVLEVMVRSNGSSNISSFLLKDEDENYMTAQISGDNGVKDDVENIYQITGSNTVTLTYEIAKAGTYTLCTAESVTVNSDIVLTNRVIRIDGISMTDVFEEAE